MILAGIKSLYSKYSSDRDNSIRNALVYTHLIPDIWNIVVEYARLNEDTLSRLINYSRKFDTVIDDGSTDYKCKITIIARNFDMDIVNKNSILHFCTDRYPHVEVGLIGSNRHYLARSRYISTRVMLSIIFDHTPETSGYEIFRESFGGEYLWYPINNDIFRSNLCTAISSLFQKFIDDLIW